ncbi:MAG: uncharacterized protein KVP18_002210 [Porospora cf. gigantea A]|uniref:uncharacterized protein n=1 Tax=Porospora cf. gigantea A TaxID=2853593 RepID=UPI00355A93E1|nr:MAG: hypothetical protein KVP18_002210 [Porospora cf. gigantea A]
MPRRSYSSDESPSTRRRHKDRNDRKKERKPVSSSSLSCSDDVKPRRTHDHRRRKHPSDSEEGPPPLVLKGDELPVGFEGQPKETELENSATEALAEPKKSKNPKPREDSKTDDEGTLSHPKPHKDDGRYDPTALAVEVEVTNRLTPAPEPISEWKDLKLDEKILSGLYGKGFLQPSSIQRIALPILLREKSNLIGQSKNGTGKTATFSLAMISIVDPTIPFPQAVVIAPTHELAKQNQAVLDEIAKYTELKSYCAIPNQPACGTAHLVSGTPGKTLDLFTGRSPVSMKHIKMLVLDEADHLINPKLGLHMPVNQLVARMGKMGVNSQKVLFSATFDERLHSYANSFAPQATFLRVNQKNLVLSHVEQRYVNCVDRDDKYAKLIELYCIMVISQSIIFVNSKELALNLAKRMTADKHAVSVICGTGGAASMTSEQREKTMEDFRTGVTKVLITTDLLARGIDVPQVTLVINYEMPISMERGVRGRESCPETYLHRVGRTGRFGQRGLAINFIIPGQHDELLLRQVEEYFGTKVAELAMDMDVIEKMMKEMTI